MTPDLMLVNSVAAQFRLPPDLLAKQIVVESGWDEWAFRYEQQFFLHYLKNNTSAKGHEFGPLAACSYGLLQILYEVALEIGFTGPPEELFDPQTGLLWGAKKLRTIWDTYPRCPYEQVLAIYNGGPSYNTAPPYRNQDYVTRVMSVKG